jgi:hypothetical protein
LFVICLCVSQFWRCSCPVACPFLIKCHLCFYTPAPLLTSWITWKCASGQCTLKIQIFVYFSTVKSPLKCASSPFGRW